MIDSLSEFLEEWHSASPFMLVHTSGSTGVPKTISVEKKRMEASALMTCRFLNLNARDTALLCMPLKYIAGKMIVVRSIVSGMRLVSVTPSSHPLAGIAEVPTFAAMVPMQVASSVEVPEELEKLKRIKHLIIGGGAVDERLASVLQTFPNNVWSTYGMTETLSHIAMRRLNGAAADLFYTPMPEVKVWANDERCLCIDAPQICDAVLTTHDIVEFASDGKRFRILGRLDNVINSGGVKIQTEEVEEVIKKVMANVCPAAADSQSVSFAITSKADAKFGEAVVMAIARGALDGSSLQSLKEGIKESLPKYWQPKEYRIVDAIPLAGNGKIARAKLKELIG